MNHLEKIKQKLEEAEVDFKLHPVSAESLSIDDTVAELGISFSEGLSTLLFESKGKIIAVLRRDDRNIDNKALKKILGFKPSFAGEETLAKLELKPGLASPFVLEEVDEILVDVKVEEMSKVICGTTTPEFALEIQKDDLLDLLGDYKIAEISVENPKRQDEEKSGRRRIDSSPSDQKKPSKRILTGDRPTGPLHLGHYVGSVENRVKLQNEFELFYMIADVQALTDNHKDPEKVRANVFQVAQDNLACGVDPEISTIFIQSMIPEIAELTVFFMNLVTHSEMMRNPTIKTEIKEKGFGDSVPFGFVAYPISQAGDILFCRSNLVPVGKDQAPMIELSRTVAKRFNKIYGDVFNIPKAHFGVEKNLVGTDGGAKMSKSIGNTINLNATKEEVNEQVKKMYTDPNRIKATDPGKVEGNPVFIYHDFFNDNEEEVSDLKDRYKKGTVGDVEVKEKLAAAINKFLDPIRERREQFPIEKTKEIVMEGTKRTKKEAEMTMQIVREKMKIDY